MKPAAAGAAVGLAAAKPVKAAKGLDPPAAGAGAVPNEDAGADINEVAGAGTAALLAPPLLVLMILRLASSAALAFSHVPPLASSSSSDPSFCVSCLSLPLFMADFFSLLLLLSECQMPWNVQDVGLRNRALQGVPKGNWYHGQIFHLYFGVLKVGNLHLSLQKKQSNKRKEQSGHKNGSKEAEKGKFHLLPAP